MLKKVIVMSAIVIMFAGLGQAAEFTAAPKVDNPAVGDIESVRLPNITQSTDPVTIAGATVACAGGGTTTQNQWLRRFLLNTDHAIVQQYDVTSIDWAIGAIGVQDIGNPTGTVNIYALANGAAFTYALMGAAIGTTSVPLTPANDLTHVNFPVAGSIIDPSTTDLVAEFVMPDGQGGTVATDLWDARVGDNANGEIRDSYIAASACAINEPTTMTAIGFPTAMIVLTVNGNEVPVELMAFSVE